MRLETGTSLGISKIRNVFILLFSTLICPNHELFIVNRSISPMRFQFERTIALLSLGKYGAHTVKPEKHLT